MFADEKKIDLYHACKIAPGYPAFASVWRWCVKGLKGVRLEYLRVGKRMFTSAEALNRFYAALTALDQIPADKPAKIAPPKTRRESSRTRAITKARATLQAAGI